MTESEDLWTTQDEKQWKRQLSLLFKSQFDNAFDRYESPLEVGNRLGDLLREIEAEVAKGVVRRSVRKWSSPDNLHRWEDLLDSDTMLLEFRAISTSIANTMRPLAGNRFVEEQVNESTIGEESAQICMLSNGRWRATASVQSTENAKVDSRDTALSR